MWENIKANNSIEANTEKAVLIRIPKTDLKFWHPSKLVRTFGKSDYAMSFGVCEGMTFRVFRNGKGRYNRLDKTFEVTISLEELKGYFKNSMEHFGNAR